MLGAAACWPVLLRRTVVARTLGAAAVNTTSLVHLNTEKAPVD